MLSLDNWSRLTYIRYLLEKTFYLKAFYMININWLKKTKFFQSFKFDKNFIYIILIDLVYYSAFYVSLVIYFRNLIPKLVIANKAKDLIGLLSKETLSLYQSDLAIIKEANNSLTIYAVMLIIVLFLNFSCCKLWIWHLMVKKKYRLILLAKGMIVNLIFLLIILILGLAGFYTFKTEIFLFWLLLLIPISLYFSNWIQFLFAQKGTINAIYQGIYLGVKRFFYLLIPYLIIIGLLFLLLLIIRMFAPLNSKIYWPIFFLAITIFLNWAKHLLYLYKKNIFFNIT